MPGVREASRRSQLLHAMGDTRLPLNVTAAAGPSAGQAALWAIVYAIGTIPLGFACVLQEQVFEECPTVSVLQMSFWVSQPPPPSPCSSIT